MTAQLRPYLTVAGNAEKEIPAIKGSRFIGFTARVDSDESAQSYVKTIVSQYPDARHWCWAYQLKEQQRTRFDDDGEPSGSAGKPILAPIVGRELLDVIVVVVRYFGGVKLGVGGLVRAYSQAANAVLENAHIIEIIPTVAVRLEYAYAESAHITTVLSHLGLDEIQPQYTDRVESTIHVTPESLKNTITQITNYTAGKACVTIVE